jgi:hypothetical protein
VLCRTWGVEAAYAYDLCVVGKWTPCLGSHVDERIRFVARVLEGGKMTAPCSEFGISRKTGYKIFDRYKTCGVQAVQRSQPTTVSPGESTAAAA